MLLLEQVYSKLSKEEQEKYNAQKCMRCGHRCGAHGGGFRSYVGGEKCYFEFGDLDLCNCDKFAEDEFGDLVEELRSGSGN